MPGPITAAKILRQRTYPVTGQLQVTEHHFEVPLDHWTPSASPRTIQLFGRSVRKSDTSVVRDSYAAPLPWMVYLQGGPGFPCRPPQHNPCTARILDAGYNLLFLDPRGTGLSAPLASSTLPTHDASAAAAQLKLYRADSIVRDLEAVRLALTAGYPADRQRWSTIGQSFGGFVTLSYLSFHPEGLRECLLFGGLQPLVRSPDEVYRRLFKKVRERNDAYYRKFPEDVERVKRILEFLRSKGDGSVTLPSGGALTRRRFLQMGMSFGGHGGLDSVHDMVLRAAMELETVGHLTYGMLAMIDNDMPFDSNPLYAILHEPIYCEGNASNWSAHRIQHSEYPEFVIDDDNSKPASAASSPDHPALFTGEMIFPWMFEDYAALRPLRETAELLAKDSSWPALFDEYQLAQNKVPVYAASYLEDMYVASDLALATASKIKGCKVFTTNVMFHDAVRSRADEVLAQVFALRNDVVD